MTEYTINSATYWQDLQDIVEALMKNETDTDEQGKLARLLAYLKVINR